MARYRSRSRSYSPQRGSRTPPRSRKLNEDDPRVRRSYRERRSPAPSGLLLRNLPLNTRPEDLRAPFERFGPVKDVYLPKNYHTGEPRGFGFVKFRYAEDAAEAKQQMNHRIIGGREVRIVFAEENRKTPREMRTTERVSGRSRGNYRRRSLSRSPRRRYRSYSRSLSPARSRETKALYRSPARSGSPLPRDYMDRRPSKQSPSPKENGRTPMEERDYYPPSRSGSP
ncbi:serine/arginine-rich SC35-like splicing factor SCL28 [Punica granatum]|uniref:Serine/arginine-rich SC35-like splicing factor SCL28 n=1 Tax=Punica granatum TaxID=22663 RepID=A0A6P8CVL9_PUNGR|nr:serine/arginine-rich SC35-like splicing factor SCL28 [Punica granatum]